MQPLLTFTAISQLHPGSSLVFIKQHARHLRVDTNL